MKKTLIVGLINGSIGAVAGVVSGLAGLWGGPVEGALILAATGFICGCVNQARRGSYRKSSR